MLGNLLSHIREKKEMIRKNCDYIASIPLKGKVNSLNASVAAGILIYEIVKNRWQKMN